MINIFKDATEDNIGFESRSSITVSIDDPSLHFALSGKCLIFKVNSLIQINSKLKKNSFLKLLEDMPVISHTSTSTKIVPSATQEFFPTNFFNETTDQSEDQISIVDGHDLLHDETSKIILSLRYQWINVNLFLFNR